MWGAGSPLMLIWARSIGADLRAALISPPQHFTGEHLNIHVKTVTPQYSFHFFPSVFISKSNMGHENMCMHKEYKPYDCSSAGGQAGRGRVRTQSAEKEQEQKRLSCFILLKACLKQHFLSRDTVVLLKQSEVQKDRGGSVFVLFTFFSWPRIPKQRRAWRWSSTFWAFFSPFSVFFPPFFFWYVSSCWLQMQQKPTLLYWKHYWREFGLIAAALCMSETSEGLSLALLSHDVKVSPRWRVEKLRWIDLSPL